MVARTSTRVRYSTDERLTGFVDAPTIQREENSGDERYNYRGVEVRWISKEKGHGVFATEPLAKGFVIPYGGKPVTDPERIVKWKRNPDRIPKGETIKYVIDSYSSPAVKKPDCYVDAAPNLYPRTAPKYAWIGSKVNAANSPEEINCKLTLRHGWSLSPKGYPYPHSRNRQFVETTRVVNPGEELLTTYGLGTRIELTDGFGPANGRSKREPLSETAATTLRRLQQEKAKRLLNNPAKPVNKHPTLAKIRRTKMTPY